MIERRLFVPRQNGIQLSLAGWKETIWEFAANI